MGLGDEEFYLVLGADACSGGDAGLFEYPLWAHVGCLLCCFESDGYLRDFGGVVVGHAV